MIKKLKIKNFKSFIEDEIDFPNFTAVIGKNGAGKSTLLQAIYVLKKLADGENINSVIEDFTLGSFEVFNGTTGLEEIELDIFFQTNESSLYHLFLKFGYKDRKSETTSFALAIKEEALHCVDEKLVIRENIYSRKGDKIYNSENKEVPLSVDSDKLALSIYKENHAKTSKKYLSGMQFINHSLGSALRSSIALESGDKTTLSSALLYLMKKNPQDFDTFKRIVTKFMPDFKNITATDFRSDNKQEAKYFLWLENKKMESFFSFKTLSSGDFRILYYFAISLISENFSTILIDEIENGLHPHRLKEVVEHLEVIAEKRDIQFIFSTHSPLVINNFKPQKILFIQGTNKGSKTHKILDHAQSEQIGEFLNKGGEITDLINVKFK